MKSLDLYCERLSVPFIRLVSCSELSVPVQSFLATWPLRAAQVNRSRRPLIWVSHPRTDDYVIRTSWRDHSIHEPNLTCFLCSLAIEAVMGFCQLSSRIHMHAAAIQVKERLYLLLGGNHAGKSCLTVRLMLENCVGYGDDLVGIGTDARAFSFGIPPRLRLPLPDSPVLRNFVRAHAGETDGRYLYVESGEPLLAPFGTQRKIDACVFLHRNQGKQAALRELKPDLDDLLSHCVLYAGAGRASLAAMRTLSSTTRFFRLDYEDLDDAAALLLADESRISRMLKKEEPEVHGENGVPLEDFALSGALFRRARDVAFVPERQGAYLIHGMDDAIFRLNLLGKGIWLLLEQPLDEHEAALLLQEVFPDTPSQRIRRDVHELFSALREEGLIEPVVESPPKS